MSQGTEHLESVVVGWIVKRAIQAVLLSLALTAMPLARAQSDAGADAPLGDAPDPFRQLVDSDPFAGDDPVGTEGAASAIDPISAGDTSELRSARLPSEDELVSERLPIVRGEVLEAIAGVREVGHRTSVELVAGLALVRTELRFESSARYAAELAYRLPVPTGAVPFALEVWSADGRCRSGRVEEGSARFTAYDASVLGTGSLAPGAAPVASVERVVDARGIALRLRAAPIPPAGRSTEGTSVVPGALLLRLAYSVPTEVHGGVARVSFPARGADVRAAVATVDLHAVDLVAPRLEGAEVEPDAQLERGPASGFAIEALVPRSWTTHGEAWSTPCGRERCVWARAMTARPTLDAGNVVLAIDASPSTTAGARGLLPEAALAILAQLPPSARVRVVAFASRAEVLIGEPVAPTRIDDVLLQRAAETELGSATRFEALWGAIEPWMGERDLRVVWLGDGGLTSSDEGSRAVASARSRGLALHVVSVAERAPTEALESLARTLGASIVQAHGEALLASRSRSRDALAERLASVVAAERAREVSVVGLIEPGAARARLLPGGSATFSGRANGRVAVVLEGVRTDASQASGDLALAVATRATDASRLVAADGDAGASRCGEGDAVLRPSIAIARVTALPNRFARVERRSCREAQAPSAASSARPSRLSGATLLRAMRQRIIPRMRDCFRSDRRGRAEYSTAVSLILTLADQEIVDVRAEGAIEPALRSCMLEAVDGLEVPVFEGVVVARWPLYSRPEMPPPTLELHPDLATAIDHLAPAHTGE